MKQRYRADHLRTSADEDDNLVRLWKKMTVFDVTYGVYQGWSSMNPVMPV
jgi:hypothetical protein